MQILADAIVVLHMSFVMFVLAGSLLVVRWPRVAWLHLPAVGWGVAVELAGRQCPLTPLENWFRERGSGTGVYSSSFVEHYVMPLLYPASLTRNTQIALGLIVLGINAGAYAWLFCRRRSPAA